MAWQCRVRVLDFYLFWILGLESLVSISGFGGGGVMRDGLARTSLIRNNPLLGPHRVGGKG